MADSRSYEKVIETVLQAQNKLPDLNAQEKNDVVSAMMNTIRQIKYLAVPSSIGTVTLDPARVGTIAAGDHISREQLIRTYALNKARAPKGVDAVKFALVRAEAVKAGWVVHDDQKQMVIDDSIDYNAALAIVDADQKYIAKHFENAHALAFVLPLLAEHTFRTMGEYYSTSHDSAAYSNRYAATIRACSMPHLIDFLPPDVLYSALLQWVSPGRAWSVLKAQEDTTRIPDGLKLRATAAPSGTTVVTATGTVIEALTAAGFKTGFEEHGDFNLDQILAVADAIKANPPPYHKDYAAYGVAQASVAELAAFESAKREAIRFAPYSQAFINTHPNSAGLHKAMCLRKYAEQNPVMMMKAEKFFRNFKKT